MAGGASLINDEVYFRSGMAVRAVQFSMIMAIIFTRFFSLGIGRCNGEAKTRIDLSGQLRLMRPPMVSDGYAGNHGQ